MSNGKLTLLIFVLILMVSLACGMIYYTTVYIPQQEQIDNVNIYTAKVDIADGVKIEAELFDIHSIPRRYALSSMVTDLKPLIGKVISGRLDKGDLLTKNRVNESQVKTDSGIYLTIIPSNVVSVNKNDRIRVYARDKVKSGLSPIDIIYGSKVVLGTLGGDTSLIRIDSNQRAPGIIVSVTNEEYIRFIRRENSADIIVAKLSPDYSDEIISTSSESILKVKDSSEEGKEQNINSKQTVSGELNTSGESIQINNAKNAEIVNKTSVITVDITAPTTIDDLSKKYDVPVESIKAFNANKTTFVIGDKVFIPSK